MTYIFDDLEIAREFIHSFYTPCVKVESVIKFILINTPHDDAFMQKYHAQKEASSVDDEVVVDCIYFDDIVGDGTDPLPYRIFKYFTMYDCHDEYLVYSGDCKQYYPCVSCERLFEVKKVTDTKTVDGKETSTQVLQVRQFTPQDNTALETADAVKGV